jgi:hypothetical protein
MKGGVYADCEPNLHLNYFNGIELHKIKQKCNKEQQIDANIH